MMTVKQVAKVFQVKDYTIREWARLGKIKAVKVGNRWMITRQEVERIQAEGTREVEKAH